MVGPPERPVPAANLIADFAGGSMFLVAGVLAALVERNRSGLGQTVDAAMVDGAASLATMLYGMLGDGHWVDRREANLLDGGAPFYGVYRCRNGGHVAVGAIEPQFYAELLAGLGLAGQLEGGQLDRDRWPDQRARLEAVFATRTRDEWARHFGESDACVTPVLSMSEALAYLPHKERGLFVELDGVPQPVIAPRFSRSRSLPPRLLGSDETGRRLAAWGMEVASAGDPE
jgi:alpha-methylacyl-CoA racemase